MVDKHLGLFSGRAGSEAIVRNAIADEDIFIGDPVIFVAPPAGERDPRVEPNAAQGVAIAGIVVDGDQKGLYDDGLRGATEKVAAAGEAVKLVTKGRVKARVKGDGTAIVLGEKLTLSATEGHLEKAIAQDEIGAVALDTSSGADDFILVEVDNQGAVET